jgi:hypothetical protein
MNERDFLLTQRLQFQKIRARIIISELYGLTQDYPKMGGLGGSGLPPYSLGSQSAKLLSAPPSGATQFAAALRTSLT